MREWVETGVGRTNLRDVARRTVGPPRSGGARHRDEPGRKVRPWMNKNRMVNREWRSSIAPLTVPSLPESGLIADGTLPTRAPRMTLTT